MSKDSEAPPARQISRAKARVAKQAAPKPIPATPSKPSPGSGIAGSVISMNEETRKELETALGTKNISFNTNLFVRTARTAFVFQGGDIHAGAEDALNQTATLVAIKAFKPTDPVEAMIAAQAVMLHNLAMEAGRRGADPPAEPRRGEQAPEGRRERRQSNDRHDGGAGAPEGPRAPNHQGGACRGSRRRPGRGRRQRGDIGDSIGDVTPCSAGYPARRITLRHR